MYIDDIVIYSKSEEDHIRDIEDIFKTLEDANMKVQLDNCPIFKPEVEFLGFVISQAGIKTNLKELQSLLGLSGYYRRFIRVYVKLAKPLTTLLRREEGHVSKRQSLKIAVEFNEEAMEAFAKIKNSLVSNNLLLFYPNYEEYFELTTDALEFALGAVLSQKDNHFHFKDIE